MRVETALPELPVGLPDLMNKVGATLHALNTTDPESFTTERDEMLAEDDLAAGLVEDGGPVPWRSGQPGGTLLSANQHGRDPRVSRPAEPTVLATREVHASVPERPRDPAPAAGRRLAA